MWTKCQEIIPEPHILPHMVFPESMVNIFSCGDDDQQINIKYSSPSAVNVLDEECERLVQNIEENNTDLVPASYEGG